MLKQNINIRNIRYGDVLVMAHGGKIVYRDSSLLIKYHLNGLHTLDDQQDIVRHFPCPDGFIPITPARTFEPKEGVFESYVCYLSSSGKLCLLKNELQLDAEAFAKKYGILLNLPDEVTFYRRVS